MRTATLPNISSQVGFADSSGAAINADQLFRASAQFVVTGSAAAGSGVLEASNDGSHWSTIGAAVTVSGPGSYMVEQVAIAYEYIRTAFTSTEAGAQTITTIADTGALEVITVTVPATAAATQADYFVLHGPVGSAALWLDIDGANVPPTGAAYVAATTKIKVSINTGDSAVVNAGAVFAAAGSTEGYNAVDNGNGTVTYTQADLGLMTAPAKHNADDTGAGSFLVHVDTAGHASNLLNTYFLVTSAADTNKYAVWMDVGGYGVAPTVAGYTVTAVTLAVGDTAANNATAIAAVLDPLTGLNAAAVGAVITVTNTATGTFTQAHDSSVPTNFTFALDTAANGVISSNIQVMGF